MVYYEECEGDFVSERYTLQQWWVFRDSYEVFDDKTQFIQKRIFV